MSRSLSLINRLFINSLDNSKILEDIISIYECLKLLKFAEIVKLKIIHSLRDDEIFWDEFFQTLNDLEDDTKFKDVNIMTISVKEILLTTIRNISNQAILGTKDLSELQDKLNSNFSDIESLNELVGESFESGKKISQNFKKMLESKLDIVYVIHDGKTQILAKCCE